MINLIRVELYKLRTTRLFAGLTLAVALLIALITVIQLTVGDELSNGETGGAITTEEGLRDAANVAGLVILFGLVLGATALPGEHRFHTITPTLLATPARWKVVAAKASTYALAGAAMAVVAETIVLGIVATANAINNDPFPFGNSVITVLALGPVAVGIATAFGVGIGAAVPSQLGSVLVTLGWVMVVEQLLSGLIDGIGPWLPITGAAAALTAPDPDPTRMVGLVVVVLYALAALIAGIAVTEQRDIA